MSIGAIVLIDDRFPQTTIDQWKLIAADFGQQTGTEPELLTGDAGALSLLSSALAATPRTWTRQRLEPDAPPPPPMTAAEFVYREDGRPDWSAMWTTFCELALFGGPPHRGPENAVRWEPGPGSGPFDPVAEIRRGIFETTGLFAEAADQEGWLAITCASPQMAAWMCACIVLENVEARMDGDRLLVPACDAFTLKDQVKSVITVVAKVHHYWEAHIESQATAALAAG